MTTIDLRDPSLTAEKIVCQDCDSDDVVILFGDFIKVFLTYEQGKAVWAILEPTFGLPGDEETTPLGT